VRAPSELTNRVLELRSRYGARDAAMWRVGLVRNGNLGLVAPDHFSEDWPQSMVANMVDVIARDVAESISPLPALNCSSGSMKTDTDKKRAAKKNKGGMHYWAKSNLKIAMLSGADRYCTHGFLPFYVHPDFGNARPMIDVEDGVHAYYDLDRTGAVQVYAKVYRDRLSRLIALFGDDPSVRSALMANNYGSHYRAGTETEIEVVRFCDTHSTVLYCPTKENVVLAQYANPVDGVCPYFIAERPKLAQLGVPRGQFDDVIYVQIARQVMAQLTMEAGKKSVQAPIAAPPDLVDLPIGPDAIWRSETPEKIGRVPLNVPREAFALGQELEQEVKIGARYPGTRAGQVEASVITGRGVQQLSAGYETQIDSAQTVIGEALRKATEYAFQLDEKLWPDQTRTIDGTLSGETFHEDWRPSRDIDGKYSCDVTYGFAAGLAPAQKVVMLLQLRADGDIDRDTLRRQLPWEIDVEQMQRSMDVQAVRDAAVASVQGLLGMAGQMAVNGMDPTAILSGATAFIKGRQDGKAVEDLLGELFPAPAPPPQPEPGSMEAAGAEAGGGPAAAAAGGTAGAAAGGPPQPGQPGGPGVQDLIAAFRGGNGQPAMSASVRRRTVAA
jgi:hypothetical protein